MIINDISIGYSNASTTEDGLMSKEDKTKLNGIAEGATANIGTITGITMNSTSKGTTGVVDLGTVVTEHQTLKTINSISLVGSGDIAIASLPSVTSSDNGKVLSVVNGAWGMTRPMTAVLNVTTQNNTCAEALICTNEGTSAGKEVNGAVATFYIPSFGIWTVSGTVWGATTSKNVTIDSVSTFNETLELQGKMTISIGSSGSIVVTIQGTQYSSSTTVTYPLYTAATAYFEAGKGNDKYIYFNNSLVAHGGTYSYCTYTLNLHGNYTVYSSWSPGEYCTSISGLA